MIGQVLLWVFAVIGGLAVLLGGLITLAGVLAVAANRMLAVSIESGEGLEEIDEEGEDYLHWLESDLWGRG